MVRGAALSESAPWRRMPLGATYLGDGSTSFVVWAPRARAIDVAVLDEAGAVTERHTLTAGADGYFHGTARVPAGARYKYALTGRKRGSSEQLFPDPASTENAAISPWLKPGSCSTAHSMSCGQWFLPLMMIMSFARPTMNR